MARTFKAEGRQVAYLIRGLIIIGGLAIYFSFPGYSFVPFFGILFGAVVVSEIAGVMWTKRRRQTSRQSKKRSSGSTSAARAPKAALSESDLLKADVHTLSGTEFERLMALYYTDQGYVVQPVGGSGDHEVDLILKDKAGLKIAVQCKRWKKDIGNDIVLRLKAGKQVHGCYDAWIVTTSNFTRSAKEAAEKLNIKLINGLIVEDKLSRWKKKKNSSIAQ